MVAENAVNFLVANYPLALMPTNTDFKLFGMEISELSNSGETSVTCETKTIVRGSGTSASSTCDWSGNNADCDHFSSSESCMTGNYSPVKHPHLNHNNGTALWINGNVTIPKCSSGGFKRANHGGSINYTGTFACGDSGSSSNFIGVRGALMRSHRLIMTPPPEHPKVAVTVTRILTSTLQ